MLGKLCLTPRKFRDYSTVTLSTDLTELLALDESTLSTLLAAFEEKNWLEIIAICDQNDASSSANSSIRPSNKNLYDAAEAVALNETIDPAARINAYFFLRSQNQHVSSPGRKFLNFAEFIYQSNHPEALAILLLDNYFPENGLKHFSEEAKKSAATHFSALIAWAQSNTDPATLHIFLRNFASLKNPIITMELIEYGFNGICTWEELFALFSPLDAIEGDKLFNIFFLNNLINTYSTFAEGTISDALELFTEMPELQDLETAHKIFNIFIAPVLKAHPQFLLSTGQKIFTHYPQLLNAFSQLIPSMILDAETVDFSLAVANKLANNWIPLATEDDLPENIKSEIITEIATSIETKYSSQFEKFITDFQYGSDRAEAKKDFPNFMLREASTPLIEARNAELKEEAQQKLHQIFSTLTTASDYSKVGNSILQLLNHPDFKIEEYYAQASEAFKQLPYVIITMQLHLFKANTLPTDEINARVVDLHEKFRTEGCPPELKHYYAQSILARQIAENNAALNSGSTGRIFKTTATARAKAGIIYGKEAKTPFLSAIFTKLITSGNFENDNGVPFIWDLYISTYLCKQKRPLVPEEMRYSYQKIEQVHAWLRDVVFDTLDAPETQALKEALFQDAEYAKSLFGIVNHEIARAQDMTTNFDYATLTPSETFRFQIPVVVVPSNDETVNAIECLKNKINELSIVLNGRVESKRKSLGSSSFLTETIKTYGKGDALNGKTAKIYVLSWFLERLLNGAGFDSIQTATQEIPVIWDLYVSACQEIKEKYLGETITEQDKQYSPEKIKKVNEWLLLIFDRSNAPETAALKSIPEDVREAVFGFAGSIINPKTLTEKSVLSFMFREASAGAGASESCSISPAHK